MQSEPCEGIERDSAIWSELTDIGLPGIMIYERLGGLGLGFDIDKLNAWPRSYSHIGHQYASTVLHPQKRRHSCQDRLAKQG